MRHPLRLLALGLAVGPLFLAGCRIEAGSGPAGASVECAAGPGTDARSAAALCAALRAEAPDRAMRLTVLATGPAMLSARLDLTGPQGDRPGQRLDFTVSDRDLTDTDYRNFARDLLLHGLPD